jgi:alpha-amylase/alpha-mannosidase (GH57 family)
MNKYICIHGHFYQPPRENPWLEAVELQDSAFPYHDWNERITAECYAPNATARLLDGEGRIAEITNNYSKISFNFGPTLLAWMLDKEPETYQAILDADHQSRERFSGHGSALAQVYNHIILPLANKRDQQTQVAWGIRDFEFRFGRRPEGMWLSETAADLETFETLVDHGIRFTILSPYQAHRVRRIGGRAWQNVNGGRVDPAMPYQVKLPSGKSIVVFFYDAPVSQAVAFERLLADGNRFADRLMSALSDKRPYDQMVHIATDGESYGHHHRAGEMALAYALKKIEKNPAVQLTIYGEYLERHPPTHEAEIHEKSAWSCSHGVERWKSDCGCSSGGRSGWNQLWRTPLRESLDWLRDELVPRYERRAAEFLKDPWAARNEYIQVILDRSKDNVDAFLERSSVRSLNAEEKVTVLKLLELQRHAMLMYTSCGWFFDEVSGIESVQVLQYAGRAIQLSQELFSEDLEPAFLDRVARAKSNLPEHCDGRCIYGKFVKPAIVDWQKVAAHYAISSLFETYHEHTRIFAYSFDQEQHQIFTAGRARLAIGRVRLRFDITHEAAVLTYGVLHLGDHNMTGGVRTYRGPEAYQELVSELSALFERVDFPEMIRALDRHFERSPYSLRSLFRDEQRKVLNLILASTLEDLENRQRAIADRYTPLMRFLSDIGAPFPKVVQWAADFILNADLRRQLEREDMDLEQVRSLVGKAQATKVALETETLAYALKQNFERLMQRFVEAPEDFESLARLEGVAKIHQWLPFDVNLWKIQNTYWKLLQNVFPQFEGKAAEGDEQARRWIDRFKKLGLQLGVRVS